MARADGRLEAQARLILDHLKGSAAYPRDWQRTGDVEYFYREHNILVRDRDVPRVVEALRTYLSGGDKRRRTTSQDDKDQNQIVVIPVIDGVTRLAYGRQEPPFGPQRTEVPNVLAHLDSAVGLDVAKPDHVLFIAAHPCPATEPEEVPRGTVNPFPAWGDDYDHGRTEPSCGCHQCRCPRGQCDGRDVFVTVADLGWLSSAETAHSWLVGVKGDEEIPPSAGTIGPYGGHGTFVAGCVRVTAPQATIYVEKVVEVTAASSGANFESEVVLHLHNALTRSPDIVVFEFTTATRHNHSLHALDALYESRLRHIKGLAFLAPAGNEGGHQLQWPAAYPWAISVGALSANWRTRAHFSNYGGWVDVYAPGEDLVNAFASGNYVCSEPPNNGVQRKFDGMAKWSGTSFATPLVAGLIASRMSCTGENGRQAADSLLRLARSQALPGVGAVLFPGQSCSGPLST